MVRPIGEQWVTSNDELGISEAAERLKAVRPEIVVMEAQGGLEIPVAGTLATVGLPLALVSPRSVRDFARAIGRIRDRDHAGLLAYFAELVRPEAPAMPDKVVEQLRLLKTRRQEILSMLAQERSRQGTNFIPVYRDVRSHIFFLERSLVTLGEEINRMVRSSSIWR
jgi:transposase